MEMELKQYYHGSREYRKGLVLRVCVLGLAAGVDDFLENLVFDPHPEEQDYYFLGAFQGDTLCATLNLIDKGEGLLLLRQFAVHPSLQGQGVGRKLLEFAHGFAREKGYSRITLDARLHVVGFYQKAGYALTGVRKVYPEITLDEMVISL